MEKETAVDETNDVGITRRIDTLGRIVIPKEIRTQFNWHDVEEITLTACVMDNEEIVIARKTRPYCAICGSLKRLKQVSETRFLCKPCLANVLKTFTPKADE